ncbi:hypothetical protein F5Y15DRAFT_385996 [Xylariaceae sp. FL0016]|nr:hypothetical protein F5Y15DRAFT_385996 [Xylariaceae sp. FL0016]
MASARKRPRPEPEDSQAECPFTVIHPEPNEKEKKRRKTKRRRQDSVESSESRVLLQASPFSPIGKFKDLNNTMDRYYQVLPEKRWTTMTRYNSFVLNSVKYWSEGFIFVANNSTILRQKNTSESIPPIKKSADDWVARILEIRASDEHHVYARVYWMYWPDELPSGTQEGRRFIRGRQSYHGQNELIASNHMDIINVVSVTGAATVNQWDETNEDEVQQALYWRQAFDVRSMELSAAELRCKCNRPENPDKRLFGCTNEKCKKWLHDDCLVHDTLLKIHARLGTDKPYKPKPVKDEEEDSAKRPLSPSESGAAPTAEQSIDVKAEDQPKVKITNNKTSVKAETVKMVPTAANSDKRRGRPRKSEPNDPGTAKPYEGLFEAVIRNDLSPPLIEIQDLRENVLGGEKTWTEPVCCLLCGEEIH